MLDLRRELELLQRLRRERSQGQVVERTVQTA
jgi:hypothetical protein